MSTPEHCIAQQWLAQAGQLPSLSASHTTELRMSLPNGRPRSARAGRHGPAFSSGEQSDASLRPSAALAMARTRKS